MAHDKQEHGHDDHGHGHLQLEYQPALPLPRGKVFLWLFLSTEIMFFAALIGVYVVIRFGAPPGTWPSPHDVHLVEPIGAINTFVLICSSVTIVLALEAAKIGEDLTEVDFYLCPVCGYIEFGKAPDNCPICGVPAAKFVLV